ncbi:hypothetical protein DIPPA_70074 [Diplonema papillatum]|nr:hypothetical protein DIPPA_70074 [Diplonema papillatum]
MTCRSSSAACTPDDPDLAFKAASVAPTSTCGSEARAERRKRMLTLTMTTAGLSTLAEVSADVEAAGDAQEARKTLTQEPGNVRRQSALQSPAVPGSGRLHNNKKALPAREGQISRIEEHKTLAHPHHNRLRDWSTYRPVLPSDETENRHLLVVARDCAKATSHRTQWATDAQTTSQPRLPKDDTASNEADALRTVRNPQSVLLSPHGLVCIKKSAGKQRVLTGAAGGSFLNSCPDRLAGPSKVPPVEADSQAPNHAVSSEVYPLDALNDDFYSKRNREAASGRYLPPPHPPNTAPCTVFIPSVPAGSVSAPHPACHTSAEPCTAPASTEPACISADSTAPASAELTFLRLTSSGHCTSTTSDLASLTSPASAIPSCIPSPANFTAPASATDAAPKATPGFLTAPGARGQQHSDDVSPSDQMERPATDEERGRVFSQKETGETPSGEGASLGAHSRRWHRVQSLATPSKATEATASGLGLVVAGQSSTADVSFTRRMEEMCHRTSTHPKSDVHARNEKQSATAALKQAQSRVQKAEVRAALLQDQKNLLASQLSSVEEECVLLRTKLASSEVNSSLDSTVDLSGSRACQVEIALMSRDRVEVLLHEAHDKIRQIEEESRSKDTELAELSQKLAAFDLIVEEVETLKCELDQRPSLEDTRAALHKVSQLSAENDRLLSLSADLESKCEHLSQCAAGTNDNRLERLAQAQTERITQLEQELSSLQSHTSSLEGQLDAQCQAIQPSSVQDLAAQRGMSDPVSPKDTSEVEGCLPNGKDTGVAAEREPCMKIAVHQGPDAEQPQQEGQVTSQHALTCLAELRQILSSARAITVSCSISPVIQCLHKHLTRMSQLFSSTGCDNRSQNSGLQDKDKEIASLQKLIAAKEAALQAALQAAQQRPCGGCTASGGSGSTEQAVNALEIPVPAPAKILNEPAAERERDETVKNNSDKACSRCLMLQEEVRLLRSEVLSPCSATDPDTKESALRSRLMSTIQSALSAKCATQQRLSEAECLLYQLKRRSTAELDDANAAISSLKAELSVMKKFRVTQEKNFSVSDDNRGWSSSGICVQSTILAECRRQ